MQLNNYESRKEFVSRKEFRAVCKKRKFNIQDEVGGLIFAFAGEEGDIFSSYLHPSLVCPKETFGFRKVGHSTFAVCGKLNASVTMERIVTFYLLNKYSQT